MTDHEWLAFWAGLASGVLATLIFALAVVVGAINDDD